jgi:phytoene dehydrogenase-like protein
MNKKIIIIGAGIAGLSAGCYLQKNGCDTEIFELHNLPGGLCTSWKRKDYIFNDGIFLLPLCNPESNSYWNELIDMKSLEFYYYDEFFRIEDKDGQFISVRTNLDQLEQELLEKAPEDKEVILEFITAVRKYLNSKEWTVPGGEFGEKCKNPLLAKTLGWLSPPGMPTFAIMLLVEMHKKTSGYPIGGLLNFSRQIEKKYLELGGKIHYKSRVKKIITRDDEAKGIRLENGDTHEADIVISAADGYSTIFDMLEGKYTDKKILHYYENCMTCPSYLIFSLGVSRTFPHDPMSLVFPLEKEIVIDPETSWQDMVIGIGNFDPTEAPEGKTVLGTIISTPNYKYWVDLRQNNKKKYKEEKQRITDEMIEALEKRFGNIKSNIEVTDLSTPATVIRYTNNWKGSPMGWLPTPELAQEEMKKVLPGLKNFYMVGHWVEPWGGLYGAIKSGRDITQVICEKDKKEFTAK